MTSYFLSLFQSQNKMQKKIFKKHTTTTNLFRAEFSKLCKFWMERIAGLVSIACVCLGGSLTGVIESENSPSSSIVIGFSTVFPRIKEIVYRLSHISGVSNLAIVHPNSFCNLWHQFNRCKLTLGDGNVHLVMFTKVSPHDLDHVSLELGHPFGSRKSQRLTRSPWL